MMTEETIDVPLTEGELQDIFNALSSLEFHGRFCEIPQIPRLVLIWCKIGHAYNQIKDLNTSARYASQAQDGVIPTPVGEDVRGLPVPSLPDVIQVFDVNGNPIAEGETNECASRKEPVEDIPNQTNGLIR